MFGIFPHSFQAPSMFGPNHADRPRHFLGGMNGIGGSFGGNMFERLNARHTADAQAKKDFKAIDTDRDGRISKAEFAALHQDAATAEKRYAQLDLDGDGRVTGAEYRRVRRAEAEVADLYRRFSPAQRERFLADRLQDLIIDW